MPLGEAQSLANHALGVGADGLGGDGTVDDRADLLDDLAEIAAFLGDQAGIGGDAVHLAPAGGLTDLIEIGGVEKELHRSSLSNAFALG